MKPLAVLVGLPLLWLGACSLFPKAPAGPLGEVSFPPPIPGEDASPAKAKCLKARADAMSFGSIDEESAVRIERACEDFLREAAR